MISRLISLIIFAAMVHIGDATAQRKIDSMYTDIAGPACKKSVTEKISGASTAVCPGVGGFHIHVLEDDERSSISVVAPDGHVFPLEYWEVVTHGFSILESRAEWRVTRKNGKVVPVAIIVRINAVDQSRLDHPKRVPLLTIAKIHPGSACVIGKVDALLQDAHHQARTIADDADLDCL